MILYGMNAAAAVRRSMLLVGWLLILAGTFLALAFLSLELNWFDWGGTWNAKVAQLCAIWLFCAVLACFITWRSRTTFSETVSLVGSVALLLTAAGFAVPEPSDLDLWRGEPPPLWSMVIVQTTLSLPGVVWFLRWVRLDPPVWHRPHITGKLIAVLLAAELCAANFLSGTVAYRPEHRQAFERLHASPPPTPEDFAELKRQVAVTHVCRWSSFAVLFGGMAAVTVPVLRGQVTRRRSSL